MSSASVTRHLRTPQPRQRRQARTVGEQAIDRHVQTAPRAAGATTTVSTSTQVSARSPAGSAATSAASDQHAVARDQRRPHRLAVRRAGAAAVDVAPAAPQGDHHRGRVERQQRGRRRAPPPARRAAATAPTARPHSAAISKRRERHAPRPAAAGGSSPPRRRSAPTSRSLCQAADADQQRQRGAQRQADGRIERSRCHPTAPAARRWSSRSGRPGAGTRRSRAS